jgi:hypothetical protein
MKAGRKSQDVTKLSKGGGLLIGVLEGGAREIAARKKVGETNVRDE